MQIPDPERRITPLYGSIYNTPYLAQSKSAIEQRLKRYLNRNIVIVFTPRLRELKLHTAGVLEHFRVEDFQIYGSTVDRKYNVIHFKLKNIGTLVLVDGDTNDLNSVPTAKGIVNGIIPVSDF